MENPDVNRIIKSVQEDPAALSAHRVTDSTAPLLDPPLVLAPSDLDDLSASFASVLRDVSATENASAVVSEDQEACFASFLRNL